MFAAQFSDGRTVYFDTYRDAWRFALHDRCRKAVIAEKRGTQWVEVHCFY